MEKANQKLEIITKYFSEFANQQIAQFEMLYPLYKEWNQKINVISRKDIDELYVHHVLHSLSIVTILPDLNNLSNIQIVDIGCGGGFPGIPLAIYYPNIQFYLVDSIGKKLKVVDNICNSLGIQNVTIIHNRIENVQGVQFDIAISRAVAPLHILWEWANPILRKNNQIKQNGLFALKGGDLSKEISEVNKKVFSAPIHAHFSEEYFKDKYVLFLKK